MAKYVFLYIDPPEEHHVPKAEAERIYGEIFKWFETNGPKFAGYGAELQPPSTATTVRKTSGKVTIVDGPFIESKESVGGYSVVEMPDRAAAIELAKTWPGYGVEVRDIVEQRARVAEV